MLERKIESFKEKIEEQLDKKWQEFREPYLRFNVEEIIPENVVRVVGNYRLGLKELSESYSVRSIAFDSQFTNVMVVVVEPKGQNTENSTE